jgi:hypothetical protein
VLTARMETAASPFAAEAAAYVLRRVKITGIIDEGSQGQVWLADLLRRQVKVTGRVAHGSHDTASLASTTV